VLGFAKKAGNRRGGHTLSVLVAGEGPDEALGTWRRAAAVVAERESTRGKGGEVGDWGERAPTATPTRHGLLAHGPFLFLRTIYFCILS
jgi:hypothetical protein